MKKLLLAVPTAMLLAAQAFAAPLQITLEGTVSALEKYYVYPRHIETRYRDAYGEHIQDNYDFNSPQRQSTSLDDYLGLQKNEKAVLSLSFDPADGKSDFVLKVGEGATALLSEAKGSAGAGSFGIVASHQIEPWQQSMTSPAYMRTNLTFANGALSTTSTAADILKAASEGKLKSSSAEVTILDHCYNGSNLLVSCGKITFSFDKTTFSSGGLAVLAVPEPSSFALLGLGLIGVAAARRHSGSGSGKAIVKAR